MLENWYWAIPEYFADLVEAAMMIVMLRQFLSQKYNKRWPYLLSALVIFFLIATLNAFSAPMLINIVLYTGFGVLIGFLAFEGRLPGRILLPLLVMGLDIGAEVLTYGLLTLAFGNIDGSLVDQTPFRVLGIIMSKSLLVALVWVAGRFSKKENYKVPWYYNLCMVAIPIFTISSMVVILQFAMRETGLFLSPIWFAFSALGLLGVNLLVVYLFEAFMNYSRRQSQYELMLQQAELLSRHLRETNALQEETQRIWHDMKNHFTVIQWMVKSKSYDKLEQYMETLNAAVANSMPAVQCGNAILDALLNSKAVEAKKYGVELSVNACLPSKLSIADIDLNILLSNALDNAVEACRKLTDPKSRVIDVDAYIRSDNLVIVIKNSFDGDVNYMENELKSTKKEAGVHGIGMRNMKKAVEKYDGHIVTEIQGNTFVLSAMLYCGVSSEKAV